MTKSLRFSAVALASLFTLVATPATATPLLGNGNAVWLADYYSDNNTSLYSLDVNVEPFETVYWGSAENIFGVYAADDHPLTGDIYYLGVVGDDQEAYLAKVDPETGESSEVNPVTFEGEPVILGHGFDIDHDGLARILFSVDDQPWFGFVDLDTAEIDSAFVIPDSITNEFQWIATGSEGVVLIGRANGSYVEVFENEEDITDVDAAVLTGDDNVWAADFVSDDVLWYTVWGDDGTEVWKSSGPGEGELVTLIPQAVNGTNDDTIYNAIFIAEKRELAETGTDEGTVPALLGVSAALVAGGVAIRRRRARA